MSIFKWHIFGQCWPLFCRYVSISITTINSPLEFCSKLTVLFLKFSSHKADGKQDCKLDGVGFDISDLKSYFNVF